MDETSRRRFHIALAVDDLDATIADYTVRLGERPAVVVDGRYAVWRTPEVNLSVSVSAASGLRHVGFEDDDAVVGPRSVDVNGIEWEAFSLAHQDAEIARVYGPPTTPANPS
jgi:catechol 2,3-dioxygenase-like lactoylglutathione lyase family enzyme